MKTAPTPSPAAAGQADAEPHGRARGPLVAGPALVSDRPVLGGHPAVGDRRPAGSGRQNIPAIGGVLLVSNHLSHLDVFVLGILVPRPLNYVARSTLFLPVLGPSSARSAGSRSSARGWGPRA